MHLYPIHTRTSSVLVLTLQTQEKSPCSLEQGGRINISYSYISYINSTHHRITVDHIGRLTNPERVPTCFCPALK